jgi:hypothetical protein
MMFVYSLTELYDEYGTVSVSVYGDLVDALAAYSIAVEEAIEEWGPNWDQELAKDNGELVTDDWNGQNACWVEPLHHTEIILTKQEVL